MSPRQDDEYQIWYGMVRRCEDKRSTWYPEYGGRGITVCERWKRSFAAFLEDMGPRPSKRFTLDRRDSDGGYEPQNCRWATRWQQGREHRRRGTYRRREERERANRQRIRKMRLQEGTVQVSYRLPTHLVARLRHATRNRRSWPPGPSQTDIVAQGIELMLRKLEKRGGPPRLGIRV